MAATDEYRDEGMYDDEEVVTTNDKVTLSFMEFAIHHKRLYRMAKLAYSHRPQRSGLTDFQTDFKLCHPPLRGGYNINWQVEFKDGVSVMVHVPIPGACAFPEEKIRAEVAVMKLVRANTTIPVPEVYHWGDAAENPAKTGPFIIMEYIPHKQSLLDEISSKDEDGSWRLKKDLPEEILLKAYRSMANILLQLSQIKADCIGSPNLKTKIQDTVDDTPTTDWEVVSRPISHNMSNLVTAAGVPPDVLPPIAKTYATEQGWMLALADMHFAHIAFQHNDAVLGPSDARDKYVARLLFRRLAASGKLCAHHSHLSDASHATGKKQKFKLWCDDIRPSNVLVDEHGDIVAVIDWETTFFAPASCTQDPPWWLIIGKPDFWGPGLRDWTKEYELHLPLFLKAMELEETKLMKHATPAESSLDTYLEAMHLQSTTIESHTSLSALMRRNWENGRFFINYAARKGSGFDLIYWNCIDSLFFGKNTNGGHEDRLSLLSDKDKEQMEAFVQIKLEQDKERKVVEWKAEDAHEFLHACLGGMLSQ